MQNCTPPQPARPINTRPPVCVCVCTFFYLFVHFCIFLYFLIYLFKHICYIFYVFDLDFFCKIYDRALGGPGPPNIAKNSEK